MKKIKLMLVFAFCAFKVFGQMDDKSPRMYVFPVGFDSTHKVYSMFRGVSMRLRIECENIDSTGISYTVEGGRMISCVKNIIEFIPDSSRIILCAIKNKKYINTLTFLTRPIFQPEVVFLYKGQKLKSDTIHKQRLIASSFKLQIDDFQLKKYKVMFDSVRFCVIDENRKVLIYSMKASTCKTISSGVIAKINQKNAEILTIQYYGAYIINALNEKIYFKNLVIFDSVVLR
jgi:hypothetical protein